MASTDPGPRDHLITRSLQRDLGELDPDLIDDAPLDAAEAPDRLARHAMGELRRDLTAYDLADLQAEQVNALLGSLASEEAADAAVVIPPKVLQGIKERSPLGDVIPL